MSDEYRFRIVQEGMTVAEVVAGDRDTALRETLHYACQYAHEGMVRIEERTRSKRWRLVETLDFTMADINRRTIF